MVLLPLLQGLLQPRLDLLPKLVAFARLTFMEKPEQPQDVLHVRLAVPVLVKLLPLPPSLILVSAQKTAMEPMIMMEDALHALMTVSLLVLERLPSLIACALSAHGPQQPTVVRALVVLLVLLPQLLGPLPSLNATARLIRGEMLKMLLRCALHVTSAVLVLLKPQQQLELPLRLLIAHALPTHTLPMVPRAHSALLILPPMAVIVLPRLLAIASPTFTEMPEPTHVLLAPMAVNLLLKETPLPPRLLIVHAQPTPTQPMESVPLVDAPLVLPHLNPISFTLLRDPDPSLTVPVL